MLGAEKPDAMFMNKEQNGKAVQILAKAEHNKNP